MGLNIAYTNNGDLYVLHPNIRKALLMHRHILTFLIDMIKKSNYHKVENKRWNSIMSLKHVWTLVSTNNRQVNHNYITLYFKVAGPHHKLTSISCSNSILKYIVPLEQDLKIKIHLTLQFILFLLEKVNHSFDTKWKQKKEIK